MQLDTHVQNNDPYLLYPYYKDIISGNKTEDNTIYKMAYPASTYPIMELGFAIYDDMGNKLDPGHYEIALSADKKYLLLIQSKRLVAKVSTVKVDFNQKEYDENLEKYNELKEKYEYYLIRKRKKKYTNYQQEMEYQQKKLHAKNKASLDYSNPKYFVIDYYCDFTTAVGVIKRASQN